MATVFYVSASATAGLGAWINYNTGLDTSAISVLTSGSNRVYGALIYTVLTATQVGNDGSLGAATTAGPTNGCDLGYHPSINWGPQIAVSPPLAADVTISGTISFSVSASESDKKANAALNARVFHCSGSSPAYTQIGASSNTTELDTTAAAQSFTITPTSTAFKRGDRIAVLFYFDDAGTMASGYTATIYYGSSYNSTVTFTETITVDTSDPAGTTVYPTSTSAGINPGSATEYEAWTSRGSGATTATTNTATGPTSPIQITATGGGTTLEWYTKQLQAFTLSGPVLINLRGYQSSYSARLTFLIEIAVTASDGTSATVWGANAYNTVTTVPISEAAVTCWVSGDDTSITNGQRLRIRVYLDDQDSSQEMVTGYTGPVIYAGTTGGASGDTYLTFSNTLTEYSAATTSLPPVRHRYHLIRR